MTAQTFPQKQSFRVETDTGVSLDVTVILTARNRDARGKMIPTIDKKAPSWTSAKITRLDFVRSDGVIPAGTIYR